MTISHDELRIEEPCPVASDEARCADGVRAWHCERCDKAVHVLSNMTEHEALELLARDDVCVTYTVRASGSIRFLPVENLVSASELSRPRRIVGAATVGLGVALAACTPHENASVARPAIHVADAPEGAPAIATVVPEMQPLESTPPAIASDEPRPPQPTSAPAEQPRERRTGGIPIRRNRRR